MIMIIDHILRYKKIYLTYDFNESLNIKHNRLHKIFFFSQKISLKE